MKKLLLLTTLLSTLSFSALVGCSTKDVSNENAVSNSNVQDSSIFTSSESSSLTSSELVSSSTISSESSSSRKSSSSKSSQAAGYKINYSSATMTMGDELQLAITNNGAAVNNITWTSSDNQLARVDSTGKVSAFFFTSENEVITITGKINSTRKLTCTLTIKPRTESIFNKCYYHSENVNQDEDGHVIYMFVHAGLEANGTLLVNKTFEYDSFTNICHIKVSKSYTESGITAYYIGHNDFYWSDYKNGLFYGYYAEVKNDVQRSALFSYSNIGFSSSNHTIFLSTSTTYRLEESDWTTITTESKVAEGVFYRVQECSEYAEEKFTYYNFGVHLF